MINYEFDVEVGRELYALAVFKTDFERFSIFLNFVLLMIESPTNRMFGSLYGFCGSEVCEGGVAFGVGVGEDRLEFDFNSLRVENTCPSWIEENPTVPKDGKCSEDFIMLIIRVFLQVFNRIKNVPIHLFKGSFNAFIKF